MRTRLLSWFWDYLVALAILTTVFVFIGLPTILGWVDLDEIWENAVLADLAITILTVVPFLVYLTTTEAGPTNATWGKRRERLHVVATPGRRPGIGTSIWRNSVKLLPWQLGHMGAARLAATSGSASLGITFSVLSIGVLIAVAGPPLLGGRGLHEILSRTTVEPVEAPRANKGNAEV